MNGLPWSSAEVEMEKLRGDGTVLVGKKGPGTSAH